MDKLKEKEKNRNYCQPPGQNRLFLFSSRSFSPLPLNQAAKKENEKDIPLGPVPQKGLVAVERFLSKNWRLKY